MSRWHTTEFDLLPERAFQPRGWKGSMTLEGAKGGSSAPPPDPRLIEAQMRSLGIQDQAIQEAMNIARTMAPLQKQQMEFGLQTARTAYDQSQQDRTWALGRREMLTGIQNRQVKEAEEFDAASRQDSMGSRALADSNLMFSNARSQQQRGMDRRGVNPNSGRAMAMSNQVSLAQAAQSAQAVNKVREAARQEGYQLTDRANNSLAGYPAMGMQATGTGAGFGASGLGLANSAMAGMSSGWNSAGGMAGQMGSNATGMYNAQANYKSNQDQIAASNDPWGAVIGIGASAAMNYAMPGASVMANKKAFSWS